MVLEDKRIFGNMPENFQPFFRYKTEIKTKKQKKPMAGGGGGGGGGGKKRV